MQPYKEKQLIHFMQQHLTQQPDVLSALLLADYLQHAEGLPKACEFITEQLKRSATLPGLQHYLSVHINLTNGVEKQRLQLLESAVLQMLENRSIYQCVQCGFSGKVLHWQCPSCRAWGTIKPITGGDYE